MRKLSVFLVLLPFLTANAQTAKVKAIDSIYAENIRTVRFFSGNNPLSTPIMELNNGSIRLIFDDMDVEIKDYMYTIEQCDRNWNPTKLDKMEYIEGFHEDRILNYKNAFTTNVAYMHYEIALPSDAIRVIKSGNYLLKVYEDDANKTVILTRRFIVYEQILVPVPQLTYSAAARYNTHHEMDVTLEPKQFRVSNPINDIRITVLQNGRWDNAVNLMHPTYTQGDKIVLDYQDSISFAAGKEWRYVDLRSTRFRSERVMSIDKGTNSWDIAMRNDLDRGREPYLVYQDFNGGYYIETTDYEGESESSIRADYVDVKFTLLKKAPLNDADVYLFGALTDWKIDPRFKLTYNTVQGAYQAEVQLKQGFYNYQYVTVSKDKKEIDMSLLEGDWYETENEYSLLVYYTPFGARHDRVIGFFTFRSNRK